MWGEKWGEVIKLAKSFLIDLLLGVELARMGFLENRDGQAVLGAGRVLLMFTKRATADREGSVFVQGLPVLLPACGGWREASLGTRIASGGGLAAARPDRDTIVSPRSPQGHPARDGLSSLLCRGDVPAGEFRAGFESRAGELFISGLPHRTRVRVLCV